MRRELVILAALIAVCSVLVGSAALVWRHIDRTRVIAEAKTSDGVGLNVRQTFNRNLGEPFTAGFHYRKP